MRKRPPPAVAINGKFLSAAPTGVHRVAAELTTALDHLLGTTSSNRDWRILKPRDATRTLPVSRIDSRVVGFTTWQPWEQLELPLFARSDLLLNLCNLGPIVHAASMVMMHDAQVFSTPESYSSKFRLWYQNVQPLLGRSSLRVLTVSEFSKQQLVQFGVAKADKIVVVPNGCDHIVTIRSEAAVLARLKLAPARYVVALANVQAHKNVGLLLRAFADDRLRNLKLVLVGKANQRQFEDAGFTASDNVIFAGTVSDEELKALYEAALCLAFPSTTEGFGLPPLEAMACGCPAVVAPCGALPEVCGKAAVYAAADDPAEWAEAIMTLEDRATLRAERSAAGRMQAGRFTWARAAAKLLETVKAV